MLKNIESIIFVEEKFDWTFLLFSVWSWRGLMRKEYAMNVILEKDSKYRKKGTFCRKRARVCEIEQCVV